MKLCRPITVLALLWCVLLPMHVLAQGFGQGLSQGYQQGAQIGLQREQLKLQREPDEIAATGAMASNQAAGISR